MPVKVNAVFPLQPLLSLCPEIFSQTAAKMATFVFMRVEICLTVAARRDTVGGGGVEHHL